MITLQQLLMTDSDPSGGTLAGKGAEGAQDFLSLLAGALTETTGKGKDAPLTLADLKAAGSRQRQRKKTVIPRSRPKSPNCSPVRRL